MKRANSTGRVGDVMSRFVTAIAASLLPAFLPGCGGGAAAGGADAGIDGGSASQCGFASDDYLPYASGYTWSYRLTDLEDGERAIKAQRIDPELTHPDYGPVLVQVTGKLSGETISLARKEGGRVLRFQQEDHDATGALERTTIYQPPQVRLDETDEHLAPGAEWDEEYTETVLDPQGVVLTQVDTVDHIQIVGVDDSCDSPMGEFRCLRVRRTRLAGGVAEKEFHFARGIGKIREVGSNQLEELTDCGSPAE